MISIKNFDKKIHFSYRKIIGYEIAKKAREEKISYQKIKVDEKYFENHYPNEFLQKYFKDNPIPTFNENCEPITVEMIKLLPIKLFFDTKKNDGLTTDGENIFLEKKWIGHWL